MPNPARHVYESFGFRLTSKGKYAALGRDLVEQTWELDLSAADSP